jgi:hypothetical protein
VEPFHGLLAGFSKEMAVKGGPQPSLYRLAGFSDFTAVTSGAPWYSRQGNFSLDSNKNVLL